MGESRQNQGDRDLPDARQVSVSPQGFESEKICFWPARFRSARCSQDKYLLPAGACTSETQGCAAKVRLACFPGGWLASPINAMVPPDSAGPPSMTLQNKPGARARIGPAGL